MVATGGEAPADVADEDPRARLLDPDNGSSIDLVGAEAASSLASPQQAATATTAHDSRSWEAILREFLEDGRTALRHRLWVLNLAGALVNRPHVYGSTPT